MNKVDKIIAYENGDLGELEILELFSELIKTGEAWTLQGHYGRVATQLIKNGWLDKQGNILKKPKSENAITAKERQLFERVVNTPNTAVIRGTYRKKKCAIVVQMFEDKKGFTMYPLAILVTQEIIEELEIDGRKAE